MEGGIWDPETEKKGIILFDPSDLYDVVEKRDWGIVVICPARDLVRIEDLVSGFRFAVVQCHADACTRHGQFYSFRISAYVTSEFDERLNQSRPPFGRTLVGAMAFCCFGG